MEKIKQVNPAKNPEVFDFSTEEMETHQEKFSRIKQPLSSTPTYIPSNYYEQFALYDGKLFVYINNTWVQIN